MTGDPFVSVIIPCFNYGHLLGETLDNLLLQTSSDWECLIIDDGSTDNSSQVALSYTSRDTRIKFYQQVNSGPSAARNYGLKLAKGDYIQFLDADDLLQNQKFEKQVKYFLDNPDCDIVYSGVKYFANSDSEKLFETMELNDSPSWMSNYSGRGDEMVKKLLKGNIMVINSPLIKRSVFERYGYFDNDLKFNEDWELWLRFAFNNVSFCFNNAEGTLALVRVHSSYSQDRFKMYLFGLKAFLKVNKVLKPYKFKRLIIPRVNYHQKIIDREIINDLKIDKNKALSKIDIVFKETGLPRYSLYSKLFKIFPEPVCRMIVNSIFIVNKLKDLLIYG